MKTLCALTLQRAPSHSMLVVRRLSVRVSPVKNGMGAPPFQRTLSASTSSTESSSTKATGESVGSSTAGSSSTSSTDSAPKDRIHSTDLAFKPNDDGWGYTKTYAAGWDRIFAKNAQREDPSDLNTSQSTCSSMSSSTDIKLQALETARACGALSNELFEMAVKELSKT